MNYIILTSDTANLMEKLVNESIQDGWKPLGGVGYAFIQQTKHDGLYIVEQYTQAMIKEEQ